MLQFSLLIVLKLRLDSNQIAAGLINMICNWVGERREGGGEIEALLEVFTKNWCPASIHWLYSDAGIDDLSLWLFSTHFISCFRQGWAATLAISRFPNTGEDYYSPRIMTPWCFCLTKQHKFQTIERFISQSPASVFVQYTIMGITTKNACISIHLRLCLASAHQDTDTAVFCWLHLKGLVSWYLVMACWCCWWLLDAGSSGCLIYHSHNWYFLYAQWCWDWTKNEHNCTHYYIKSFTSKLSTQPRSDQAAGCCCWTTTTTLERERRQLVTGLHLYLYSGSGRF